MSSDIDYEPPTLAYLRPAPEKEMAAELVVKDGDYYCVIILSDRALLNMAQSATKLIAERGFFKLEEKENGLD
jgi:hypothetical protein